VQAGKRVELSAVLEPLKVPEAVDAGSATAANPNAKGPAKSKATGKLNLRTTPWTTVYFGKKKLGETPLVGVTLPAGSQVLRVENPEAGIKSSIEVTIVEGKTTTETLSLK